MIKVLSKALTSEHKKESWKGHGKKGQATLTEVMLQTLQTHHDKPADARTNALNAG